MSKLETLKEKGNTHFNNEDYSKAVKCYKEGLELDPANVTLNCNISQAYLALGDFAEAEVHAVITLAHKNDSAKAFYRASKAALGMSKKERALRYLKTGLVKCEKPDELRSLYDELSKECASETDGNCSTKTKDPEGIVVGVKNKQQKHEVCETSRDKRILRSRSTSDSRNNKTLKNATSSRSSSVNKSSKICVKNETTVKHDHDPFCETVVKVKGELSTKEKEKLDSAREALAQMQCKLQSCMKEGSEALVAGLARVASEKLKSAVDIVSEGSYENFGLLEIDLIILKYSLSISWIQTLNYYNIIQSIAILTEIEINHAAKLPAVYFGLGSAFYQLNRFKIALQHLDKGIQFVDKNYKITSHSWPGTINTIIETTKSGLKESILNLIKECKTYHKPDAICRYKNCLDVNIHIYPSKVIFFSDPDFSGYVVIICQENCKIIYHTGCWKHYKDGISPAVKLSDRDVVGRSCLTSDCVYEENEQSSIVCIEVYGEDGKIKACAKEPSRTKNINEHRKEKKKKNEKMEKVLKTKTCRSRPRKTNVVAQNVTKKERSKSVSREFQTRLQRLTDMRSINFGLTESMQWNPKIDYFGRQEVACLKTYIENNSDSEALKRRKDFIFTYFYEYLNDEGPKKFHVVERKWSEEVSQFPGIDFISKNDGICDFLLQSYRFASVDDNLCLSSQVGSIYNKVYIEIEQSTSFVLGLSTRSVQDDEEIRKCLEEDEDDLHLAPSSYLQPVVYNPSDSHFTDLHHRNLEDELPDLGFSIFASSEDEIDALSDETDSKSNYLLNELVDREISKTIFELANPEHPLPSGSNGSDVVVNDCCTSYNSVVREFQPSSGYNSSQNSEHENVQMKEIPQLRSDLLMINTAETQTEECIDTAKEMEMLRNENLTLKKQAQLLNNEKKGMLCNLQLEVDEYKIKYLDIEKNLLKIADEKDKEINNLKEEIEKRNLNYENMVKKHKEKMDLLMKDKEEHSLLLKTTLDNFSSLRKENEQKTAIINRLEGQLRKANEQVLSISKSFGECKLDNYIMKCEERFEFMNFVLKYMQHMPFSTLREVKTAIDAWQTVSNKLLETRNSLQTRYDRLTHKLITKVSADCLHPLELPDLPKEPPYPLKNYNVIVQVIHSYLQNNSFEHNRFNRNESIHTNSHVPALHSSLTRLPYPGSLETFKASTNHLFASRPTLLPNCNYPPPLVHQFKQPVENGVSHIASLWSNPYSELPGWREKPNQNLNVFSCNNIPPPMPNNQHFEQLLSQPSESLNLEAHASANQTLDGQKENSFVPDNSKSVTTTEEKKLSSSSVSGLIPIEISKPSISDLGLGSKLNLEAKKSQHSKVWNYEKLMQELLVNFKGRTELEMSECLATVREKNGNKLSGFNISSIFKRVEKILDEKFSKATGNMGMDKFGGHAWGEVKDKNVNWNNDELDSECIICHMNMDNSNMTSLQCKHSFHETCVRKWLHTSSTCPICRKYTCLADEFPPLA